MAWPIAAMVAGGALSAYGANKQAKANKSAQNANQAAQAEAERNNWARYLMSRGIDPGQDVQAGAMPANGRAINSKLPLWMNVSRSGAGAPAMPRTSTTGIPGPATGPVVRRKAGV